MLAPYFTMHYTFSLNSNYSGTASVWRLLEQKCHANHLASEAKVAEIDFPLLSENLDRRFEAVTSFNNSADGNHQQFSV